MYCRFCGKVIADDSVFCTYCGKSLASTITKKNFLLNLKPQTSFNKLFVKHSALFVKVFCFIALGFFLFFNIKMAPFYGTWKFLAYIIEAAIAIYLAILTKNKIAESPSLCPRLISIFASILVIVLSVALRITYENKVYFVQKDIPQTGTILVNIKSNTDYYKYVGDFISDPFTSVKINGASNTTKITYGDPFEIDITCKGDHQGASTSKKVILYPSKFVDGEYSITEELVIEDNLTAHVKVKLKRVCTFWEVIFY